MPAHETDLAKLLWEQRRIPQIARTTGAGLIPPDFHRNPLSGQYPLVASPTHPITNLQPSWQPGRAHLHGEPYSLVARVRDALAEGGHSTDALASVAGRFARAIHPATVEILPPIVHPKFLHKVEDASPFPFPSEGLPILLSSTMGRHSIRATLASRDLGLGRFVNRF